MVICKWLNDKIKTGVALIGFSLLLSFSFIKFYDMSNVANKKNASINSISYIHGYSDGSYAYYAQNAKPLLRTLEYKDINKLTSNLILSEFLDNPFNRARGAKKKIKRLFRFGQTEAYFYNWKKKLKRWDANIVTYKKMSMVYRNIFLMFIFLGLLVYIYKKDKQKNLSIQIINHGVTLFFSFFVLVLILVGQTNPRYTFPIYFVAPFLLTYIFDKLQVKEKNSYEK